MNETTNKLWGLKSHPSNWKPLFFLQPTILISSKKKKKENRTDLWKSPGFDLLLRRYLAFWILLNRKHRELPLPHPHRRELFYQAVQRVNWRPRLQVTTVCSHYIQVRVKLISGTMLLNSAFHACDLKNRLKNFSTKKLTVTRTELLVLHLKVKMLGAN